MNKEIFGVKLLNDVKPMLDAFDEEYRDDKYDIGALYVSKRTFLHEEEGMTFEYKYLIEVVAFDGKTYYSLCLCPTQAYLHHNIIEGIFGMCGFDDSMCLNDIDYGDIISYCGAIQFGCEEREGEKIDDEVINLIANVYETIDGLRGFYLDKPQNMLGNNGWDKIRYFLYDEDYIRKAVERYGK